MPGRRRHKGPGMVVGLKEVGVAGGLRKLRVEGGLRKKSEAVGGWRELKRRVPGVSSLSRTK